jgi:hypothetical protein
MEASVVVVADHDQVGVVLVGGVEQRFAWVTDGWHELDLEVACPDQAESAAKPRVLFLRTERDRAGQFGWVLPDVDDDQAGGERSGELSGPGERQPPVVCVVAPDKHSGDPGPQAA